MAPDSLATKQAEKQVVEPEPSIELAEDTSPLEGEGELEEELILKEITIDGICGVY